MQSVDDTNTTVGKDFLAKERTPKDSINSDKGGDASNTTMHTSSCTNPSHASGAAQDDTSTNKSPRLPEPEEPSGSTSPGKVTRRDQEQQATSEGRGSGIDYNDDQQKAYSANLARASMPNQQLLMHSLLLATAINATSSSLSLV
ncbi:TPA: hypothetical protein ACH3X3_005027 [Trebouxia sp. C0006]